LRRHLPDLIILFVLASLVAGYVSAAQPAARNVTLHVYVFLVGGLLMLGIVAAAGDAVPHRLRSDLDAALDEASPKPRGLPELEKLEREVTLGSASAYDLHYRLLPTLRAIAQARLERSGREPSPETLGRWWELLRPDREPPLERDARGVTPAELRALVSDLARM
jgi:uncharacterized protein (DUF1501 family)